MSTDYIKPLAEYLATETGKQVFRRKVEEDVKSGLPRDSAQGLVLGILARQTGEDCPDDFWTGAFVDGDYSWKRIARTKNPETIAARLKEWHENYFG